MNREILRKEKDGGVTRQVYDKNGQIKKVIRPKEYAMHGEEGAGVQYTYDEKGRVVTVLHPDGSIRESYVYDAEGRLLQTMDGMGRRTKFGYDLGGRRTRICTSGQATQEYEYDARGNLTGMVDGRGNRTEYVLDAWGKITEIRKADGSRESYAYDYAGNLTKTIDGEGNTTTYEYNSINQLSLLTDPEGEQERYYYDAGERLCKKTDRKGIDTHYTYNMYGNLLLRRAGELLEEYEYTSEGFLKSAISSSPVCGSNGSVINMGMRYRYRYDAMGRLKEKSASGRKLLAYEYDLNGNLVCQSDITGKVTEYRYNLMDQIESVWDEGKKIAEYSYYADGTIQSVRNGESLYTEYAYDADKNLTGLRTTFGKDILVENQYRYDGNGNRMEKRQRNGLTTYAYDRVNRLIEVKYPDRKETLFYDQAGNRTRRIVNGVEELYQYDKRNRLLSLDREGSIASFTYDKAGNLLYDDRAKYEYDAFHRNTKVESFDGNIQINRYDPEGLRHEMEENGRLVSFLFHGGEIVVEETKEEKIRYIRTRELLASDAESARTYYHYASDEMGSITHVTAEEKMLNHYEYDAWGNPTVSEEKIENRFKFNGQQLDPVSQQYYLRARFYNPVIGRFTQEDSYRGDGLNLYTYCANNPVYYVDPSGYNCDPEKDRIKKNIADGTATRKEQKKLAAYLGHKERNGGLTDAERRILEQVDRKRCKGGSRHGYSVDSSMFPDDEAAGVLRNGEYVKNPTAHNINDYISEGSNYLGSKNMNGQYMYVIDMDGNIVIGTRGGQRMPHPTLVGGSNPQVQAAGMLEIRGGKIYSINNASGHFKPSNECLGVAEEIFGSLPQNIFSKDFQGYLSYGQ